MEENLNAKAQRTIFGAVGGRNEAGGYELWERIQPSLVVGFDLGNIAGPSFLVERNGAGEFRKLQKVKNFRHVVWYCVQALKN